MLIELVFLYYICAPTLDINDCFLSNRYSNCCADCVTHLLGDEKQLLLHYSTYTHTVNTDTSGVMHVCISRQIEDLRE